MNRKYPDQPIAAVGAIILRRGPAGMEIILAKRGRDPAKGKWSIPGGAIELGESAAEAAKREILEECGLQIRPMSVFDVFDNVVRDREGRLQYHYVIIDFLAEVVAGEPRPGSDASGTRWVPLSEAGTMDLTGGAREIVRRLSSAGPFPLQNL